MTIAGGLTGLAFAAAGYGLERLWADARAPLAVALGAVALAYALHEVGLVQLPVPGRSWQVPADWVREGFYRSAVIFGGTVGMGVFTRVPYASLPVLLVWLFVSGNVWFGAIAGLVYGAARALSIYSSANAGDAEALVGLNRRLMSLTPALHQTTGVALAAFGAFLVAAPVLA